MVDSRRIQLQAKLGRYEETIRDCGEAIKLDPKNTFAWHTRGGSNYRLSRYEEAIKDCSEMIKLYSENAFTWWMRGELKRLLSCHEKETRDVSKRQINDTVRLSPANIAYLQMYSATPSASILFFSEGGVNYARAKFRNKVQRIRYRNFI